MVIINDVIYFNNSIGDISAVNINKGELLWQLLMGGMSCGEVSLVPWEILKDSVKYCISLPDDDIAKTMKLLGRMAL